MRGLCRIAGAIAFALPLVITAQPFVGDTVGGTVYDWQFSGPSLRTIAWDSLTGIHTTWMRSLQGQDRSMRYNVYSFTSGRWMFDQGPNFMSYGTDAIPPYSGFGALDVNPVTHSECIIGHVPPLRPMISRDSMPGSGRFILSEGPGGYAWPDVTVTPDQRIHVAMTDDSTWSRVFYSAIQPWGTWSTPVHISGTDPDEPNCYIEGTKAGISRIAVSWINVDELPYRLYYRVSNTSGSSWELETQLGSPPAFTSGSDTSPSFDRSGHSLMWDHAGGLHVVVAVFPVVAGGARVMPAEIWHYAPVNIPQWTRIARAECDSAHLQGSVGDNALYACRPMLALDQDGTLFCTWEQFDSMNAEPTTGCLRADVFVSRSDDNGRTWCAPVKVTISDLTSHRYPSLSYETRGHRIHVLYMQDLIAGSYAQGQGDSSENPVIYVTGQVGTAGLEGSSLRAGILTALTAMPNPCLGLVRFQWQIRRPGPIELRIFDDRGRLVRTICVGFHAAGSYTADWDCIDDRGRPIANGVYFCRLVAPGVHDLSRLTTVSR